MNNLMDKEAQNMVVQLKRHGRDSKGFNVAHYLGTTHKLYNVAIPDMRLIAKEWAKSHENISLKELVTLCNKLFQGESREEKVSAAMLLSRFPEFLVDVSEKYIDSWMGELIGWEEVDSFCDEVDVWLREDKKKRIALLQKWSNDEQIEKRRASLVVLCSSVRRDEDPRLLKIALRCIDTSKYEKHVMVTKAISWLLRTLLKYHADAVKLYVKNHATSLPKIAVRETLKKLETGKKT